MTTAHDNYGIALTASTSVVKEIIVGLIAEISTLIKIFNINQTRTVDFSQRP